MDSKKIINYLLNQRFKPFADKNEWLEARRKLISGTDSATLHGYHQWVTPTQLYFSKVVGTESIQNISMMRGQYLEPMVAKLYQEETGNTLYPGGFRLFTHPELFFSGGTPDYLVVTPNDEIGVLEIKTACGFGCDKFRFGIPEMYTIQMNKYGAIVQAVLDAFFKKLDIKVFTQMSYLLDDEFKVSPAQEVNKELADLTFSLDKVFWWDNVMPGAPPPETVLKDVKLRYRDVVPEKYVDADSRAISLMQQRKQWKFELKEESARIAPLKKRIEALDMKIRGLVQDAEKVMFEDVPLATCKQDKRGTRTLLVKENLLPADIIPLSEDDTTDIERYVEKTQGETEEE